MNGRELHTECRLLTSSIALRAARGSGLVELVTGAGVLEHKNGLG